MSTMTTSTSAAALTLANAPAPSGRPFMTFLTTGKGKTPAPHGSGPPGGAGGPPHGGGGGPPFGGGPPGGGGGGPVGGGHALPGGGGGKLGGNPPEEFDGDRAKAEAFKTQFNLYWIANNDADQMTNPMKRAALFLGFIKGPNVKDWVKRCSAWIIDQFNGGRPANDEFYWQQISNWFQGAFQDSGARERAEDKLRHLSFTPNDVDTFMAQFEMLAEEATYQLDAKPTITLFASKLPLHMVNHIYKVVRPITFAQWADAVRQYHQDNLAVQNLRGLHEDGGKKAPIKKGGFTAQEVAKMFNTKLPTPDPNRMDTSAGRSRAWKGRSKGRASTTTPKDAERQRKEGRCFTCDKQGHISKNCPDKKKAQVSKGRQAELESSDSESEAESSNEQELVDAFVRVGQSMTEKQKLSVMRKMVEKQGGNVSELDFP